MGEEKPLEEFKYSELSKEFSPGDLLLFRGGDWISKTIMGVENFEVGHGDFSHVGIVVNAEALPHISQMKPDRWYVLESTCTVPYVTDGVPDIRTGATRFGVQIRDLELVVVDYEGLKAKEIPKVATAPSKLEPPCRLTVGEETKIVAWARLNNNPWHTRKEWTIHQLTKLVEKIGWKPYEWRMLNLAAAAFPWFRRYRMDFDEYVADGYHALSTLGFKDKDAKQVEMSTIFCSQLVTMAYQVMGLVDKHIDPTDVMPIEFLYPRLKSMEGLVQAPKAIVP